LGERQTEDLVVACSNQAWGTLVVVIFSSRNEFVLHQKQITLAEFLHHMLQLLVQFWKEISPILSIF
jgi:hypothetical protein